jgi:RimJ/RimL family protein N-acetyltransferase
VWENNVKHSKPTDVQLRDVIEDDLPIFFQQQLDEEANHMAAFTRKDPADWGSFMEHWSKILSDDDIVIKTILFDGDVAGNMLTHCWFGEPEVSYWIGREHWGKGIATKALLAFVGLDARRPLHARVAEDNIPSIRVLQKCGFTEGGEDRGFANGRGEVVEELLYILK